MSFARKYSSYLGKLRQRNEYMTLSCIFRINMFVSELFPSLEKEMVKFLLRYCGYRFDPVDPMI